jgi:UDP-sugar transporter A1/2/3
VLLKRLSIWIKYFLGGGDPVGGSYHGSKSTNLPPKGTKLEGDGKSIINSSTSTHAQGVAAVLTASFISGLAGALTQKSLQGSKGRNSYLFTMELCVASIFFLATSMFANPKDREQLMSISEGGFFKGWTPQTVIPILTNAAGGIIVGLVTKYAGAVKKGFALIFGLLLSGLLQARMAVTDDQDKPRVTKEQIVGGLLAAISLWMHSAFPSR